jgi:hypothetical protein
VAALATAVCANKTVIICANGWTKPPEKFAAFSGIDLELMTVEDAVELLDPDKWHSTRIVSSIVSTAPIAAF